MKMKHAVARQTHVYVGVEVELLLLLLLLPASFNLEVSIIRIIQISDASTYFQKGRED
jgi:hypothetical protein